MRGLFGVVLVVFGAAVVVALIIALWVMTSYNGIVTLDENANKAWGQVENVYQRRNDLIPNLMESVKGYMAHEKSTLTAVNEAYKQVTQIKLGDQLAKSPELQKQFFEAQQSLGGALSRLMMVANNQPNLKADKVVLSFMDEQAGAENRVATERKRFQETVETYNVKIRRFPANILAGMFGFQKREYYKSEAGAEKAPKVKF